MIKMLVPIGAYRLQGTRVGPTNVILSGTFVGSIRKHQMQAYIRYRSNFFLISPLSKDETRRLARVPCCYLLVLLFALNTIS